MIGFGLFGMLLASAWYIVIRSYRQLNSGKFKALHELEEKLAYPFFKREWDLLAEGREQKTYWRLTVVETFVPTIFFVCFTALLIIGICLLVTYPAVQSGYNLLVAQQQETQARQHAEFFRALERLPKDGCLRVMKDTRRIYELEIEVQEI